MEAILIGDVHCVAPEIPECQRLVEYVAHVQSLHPQAITVFLGDQFHTNDVMSVRVMEFWRWASRKLGSPYYLVGNHDQVHPGTVQSAMSSCRDVATVVDSYLQVGPLRLVGYCGDSETLAERTKDGSGALVCHQDFAGFDYDSGTPSHSRIMPPPPFVQVVSGHLHVPQERGQTWYPGSPRWRTLSDASVVERAVWWMRFSDEGKIVERRPYSTNGVCHRIARAVDQEGQPAQLVEGADNRVEVRGSAEYVGRRREELAAAGAQVRGVVDRAQEVRVRESDGVEASMRKFLESYHAPNGTPPEVLIQTMRKRLGLNL